MSKTMKNRGLGAALHGWVSGHKPGTVLLLDNALAAMKVKFPQIDRMACSNAFSTLHKKGLIEYSVDFNGVQGSYRVPRAAKDDGMQALITQCDKQAIDDLLTAMAKAEPALKRAALILAAVDGIK